MLRMPAMPGRKLHHVTTTVSQKLTPPTSGCQQLLVVASQEPSTYWGRQPEGSTFDPLSEYRRGFRAEATLWALRTLTPGLRSRRSRAADAAPARWARGRMAPNSKTGLPGMHPRTSCESAWVFSGLTARESLCVFAREPRTTIAPQCGEAIEEESSMMGPTHHSGTWPDGRRATSSPAP